MCLIKQRIWLYNLLSFSQTKLDSNQTFSIDHFCTYWTSPKVSIFQDFQNSSLGLTVEFTIQILNLCYETSWFQALQFSTCTFKSHFQEWRSFWQARHFVVRFIVCLQYHPCWFNLACHKLLKCSRFCPTRVSFTIFQSFFRIDLSFHCSSSLSLQHASSSDQFYPASMHLACQHCSGHLQAELLFHSALWLQDLIAQWFDPTKLKTCSKFQKVLFRSTHSLIEDFRFIPSRCSQRYP